MKSVMRKALGWSSLGVVVAGVFMAAGATGTAPASAPSGYVPDQSTPKAAAYALAVALYDGDQKTVDGLYVGKIPATREWLHLLCRQGAAEGRLERAMEKRFGHAGAVLVSPEELKLGKMPISGIFADGEVKETGEKADLNCAFDLTFKLEKREGKWVMSEIPIALVMKMSAIQHSTEAEAAATEEMAGQVEAGKFSQVYEVYPAFRELLLKRVEAGMKEDAGE